MSCIITPPLFEKLKTRDAYSVLTIISSLFYTKSDTLPSSKTHGMSLEYIGRMFDTVYENIIEFDNDCHNIYVAVHFAGFLIDTIQSQWNTSSMSAHHSPSALSARGSWQGTQTSHHFCVIGSAAIFSMSAVKSLPVYSR